MGRGGSQDSTGPDCVTQHLAQPTQRTARIVQGAGTEGAPRVVRTEDGEGRKTALPPQPPIACLQPTSCWLGKSGAPSPQGWSEKQHVCLDRLVRREGHRVEAAGPHMPPSAGAVSNTVGASPAASISLAATTPAGPAPTMATVLAAGAGGLTARRRVSRRNPFNLCSRCPTTSFLSRRMQQHELQEEWALPVRGHAHAGRHLGTHLACWLLRT